MLEPCPRWSFLVLALLLVAMSPACTRGPPPIRVGVDRSLEPLGLGRFLLAGFETEAKMRTVLRYGGTDELLKWATDGELDVVLMVSEDALQALEDEGLPLRVDTLAHEELVLIGPERDYLGRYASASGPTLLQNLARVNYRYYKGGPGSVERARHDRLFRQTGDRREPGAFFDVGLEGRALVEKAIDDQAFALVKRSSLLMAIVEGKMPHRIYRERDPALVLRLVLIELHPAKTGRPIRPELFDYIMGEAGQKAVAAFGRERFGYPLFGAGAPPEGQGAGVPGIKPKGGSSSVDRPR